MLFDALGPLLYVAGIERRDLTQARNNRVAPLAARCAPFVEFDVLLDQILLVSGFQFIVRRDHPKGQRDTPNE